MSNGNIATHTDAAHSDAIHSNATHTNAIHTNAPHTNAIHTNAIHTNATGELAIKATEHVLWIILSLTTIDLIIGHFK